MSNIKFLVTVGEGKYFSTGVDMDIVKSSDPNDFVRVLSDLQQLLSRLLVFPLVTVAAINGHCVGAGAMLAFAHDHRVMQDQRGWFFIPIVRLGYTLPVGLLELAKSKVVQPYLHHLLTTGTRYSAMEGHEAGFIAEVTTSRSTVPAALKLAESCSHELDMLTLKHFKEMWYKDLHQKLSEPYHFISHL